MSRIPLAGVYAIENTVNGRVYVGSSNDVERRVASHRSSLSAHQGRSINPRIAADYAVHGVDAFRFAVLERTFNLEEARRLEVVWTERLEAHGPGGYNMRRLMIPQAHDPMTLDAERA